MFFENLFCLTFDCKIDIVTASDAHGIACHTFVSYIATSCKRPNPNSRGSLV